MRDRNDTSQESGFSFVEALVVLAVLGAVAGLGLVAARPRPELRAAEAVRAILLQARAEAMWGGEAVAVVSLPGGAGLEARRTGGGCGAGEPLASVRLAEFPGVSMEQGTWSGGLYWSPSGSGRSCSGGGVISGTIPLRGPLRSAAVVVSSLGRVMVEAAP